MLGQLSTDVSYLGFTLLFNEKKIRNRFDNLHSSWHKINFCSLDKKSMQPSVPVISILKLHNICLAKDVDSPDNKVFCHRNMPEHSICTGEMEKHFSLCPCHRERNRAIAKLTTRFILQFVAQPLSFTQR